MITLENDPLSRRSNCVPMNSHSCGWRCTDPIRARGAGSFAQILQEPMARYQGAGQYHWSMVFTVPSMA